MRHCFSGSPIPFYLIQPFSTTLIDPNSSSRKTRTCSHKMLTITAFWQLLFWSFLMISLPLRFPFLNAVLILFFSLTHQVIWLIFLFLIDLFWILILCSESLYKSYPNRVAFVLFTWIIFQCDVCSFKVIFLYVHVRFKLFHWFFSYF